MEGIAEIMDMASAGASLNAHHQERAALRERSGGEDDFATMLVIAVNEGPTPLPGTDHGPEIRCVSDRWDVVSLIFFSLR